jgi:hypothetical protein
MELELIQVSQSNHRDLPPSPELKAPQKTKLNIKYLPSGEVSIKSEGLSQSQSRDVTDFLLTINADNILRQRATQQVCKDSNEIFNHLIAFIICSGITLLSIYSISKIFQPQPQPQANYENSYQWKSLLNS